MIKNFREVVKRIVRDWVEENVETMLPAKVIDIAGYQETQQIKVIQPLPNIIFDDLQAVEMPYIYNVPVELTGTSESLISVPIKVGDTVSVKFSKRSLRELKQQIKAEPYLTKDARRFDTADAVAFPSVLNSPANLNPHPDHTEIKFRDILVSYQDDGTIVETNDAVTRTSHPTGEFDLTNGTYTLNITPTGVLSFTSGAVSLVLSGPGDSLTVTAAETTFNGNVSITGNLGVTGASALSSAVTSNGVNISDTHTHQVLDNDNSSGANTPVTSDPPQ